MSKARNSARICASSRSLLRVLSAITRSFLGGAKQTGGAPGSNKPHEPFVAGGRFHDSLELPEPLEKCEDAPLFATTHGPTLQDPPQLVDDANRDSLLV